MYPVHRCRRIRRSENIRTLVRETSISSDKLIYPLFVVPGKMIKRGISSMPGCYQQSIDNIVKEVRELISLGIKSIILFGIPENKDDKGSSAYDSNGIIQNAVKSIKDVAPSILVITDVCLCEYTSHGHCGIVEKSDVNNDETLKLLSLQAISHAKAGADIVAPSDMMDGRIMTIRKALDDEGYNSLPIMAYSAKYASAFYGPFRDAAESAPKFGDRKTYQMDPANRIEAIKEVALDIEEGADIVMVKPALSYLDIISDIKASFTVPVAAYNVSGEYSMVKAAGQLGWIDEQKLMIEMLISIKRAGADMIITYFAKDAARILNS